MDNISWIEKAQKYIIEHRAFSDVSEISFSGEEATISAMAAVSLPSKFIKSGVTDIGVKNKENIKFIFSSEFPLVAPRIELRENFPRCFPHINPSANEVNPCIYEGKLSELLQQTEWLDGILNQLIDWLENAAADNLMNLEQGWEPMRNDYFAGIIVYQAKPIIDKYNASDEPTVDEIVYKIIEKYIWAKIGKYTDFGNDENIKKAHIIVLFTRASINKYRPNTIKNLGDFYHYANTIGIMKSRRYVESCDKQFGDEEKLFLCLAIKRPVKLIGVNTDIELLNFVVHKSASKQIEGWELRRKPRSCKVDMLQHAEELSFNILRRLSGLQEKESLGEKSIALIGCGSLGSKIGIHLARSGNGPFVCIDNEVFKPHNNARYGISFGCGGFYKSKAVSLALTSISSIVAESIPQSAFIADYSKARLLIDTTASLSVRNFLMVNQQLAPIISAGLYQQARYGLLLLENKTKTNQLVDIWAHLYKESLDNEIIETMLFNKNLIKIQLGQSCSSQTMVASDASISIMAAAMSMKIQNYIEDGLPENGEILFWELKENGALTSELIKVPEVIAVQKNLNGWNFFLTKPALVKMEKIANGKRPKETGGVLLGSIFEYSQKVVITDILPAPSDSCETEIEFILGTDRLKRNVTDIEKRSNGKITYLGTWHSHPYGGLPSETDKTTYRKLYCIRNYEPTICLVVYGGGKIEVV